MEPPRNIPSTAKIKITETPFSTAWPPASCVEEGRAQVKETTLIKKQDTLLSEGKRITYISI